MALFKAKPPVSVYKPPFVPKPSNKPSTGRLVFCNMAGFYY